MEQNSKKNSWELEFNKEFNLMLQGTHKHGVFGGDLIKDFINKIRQEAVKENIYEILDNLPKEKTEKYWEDRNKTPLEYNWDYHEERGYNQAIKQIIKLIKNKLK